MRIGLVSPYSLSVPGGVQGQVLGLARALRARGHEAVVLAPCDGPPPDVGVIPLGNSLPTASNGSIAPIAPDPSCALRTIRALWDQELDVIHLHEPLVPGPTQTALVLDTAPMIGTWHAAGRSAWYSVPGVRVLAGAMRIRCAVSPEAQAMASAALGGTYEPTFNGIEIDRYAKADPWPAEAPTVLFLGRHEPRKGLEVLLESLQHLPGDVRVWVAGTGPDTARLARRHAGDARIEWLGVVSEPEKLARLRAADVACFPANAAESFGVVLLEAMAAGTPVVAGDIAGYRNVGTHGVDALLVDPHDPAALARALSEVLDDGALADRLRDGGQLRALELSMDRLAEEYVTRYERAASDPVRRGRRRSLLAPRRWRRRRRSADDAQR